MQVNDVIQVIKTIVPYILLCKLMMLYKLSNLLLCYCSSYLLLCKLMMLYKLSKLLFVIYCYAS